MCLHASEILLRNDINNLAFYVKIPYFSTSLELVDIPSSMSTSNEKIFFLCKQTGQIVEVY